MAARDDDDCHGGDYMDVDGEEGYFLYNCDDDDAMYDDYDYEKDPSSATNQIAKENQYTVLTDADVRARQEADTAKVAEILSIPPSFAAVLLRHFKWAPDKVQEEWFSDERRVRDAVGLPPPGGVAITLGSSRVDCGVCFTGHDAGRKISAGCREHFYCRNCWQGYVHAAVDDGARCLGLRCPEPSCSAAVLPELVDVVAEEEYKNRYANFAFRSYVEESSRMKWCPGPGCSLAVESSSASSTAVSCACGHVFCFQCRDEAHRPVTCETVRAWAAKNSSDSENANWVLVHTKLCPKCRRPIEKNQGCMHMTCTAPCHHEFCWVCLDPWDYHKGCAGFHQNEEEDASENSNADPTVSEERHKRQQARASLERYLYHYERWAANQLSLNMADTDLEQLQRSGLQAMAAAAGTSDLSKLEFMTDAYRQIVDGRRVLRWTYAYGYFLDPERDGTKRELFEDLQDQANFWLDRLHESVELERKEIFCATDVDAAVVAELLSYYQKKVVNLTQTTQTFLGNLIKAFESDLPEISH